MVTGFDRSKGYHSLNGVRDKLEEYAKGNKLIQDISWVSLNYLEANSQMYTFKVSTIGRLVERNLLLYAASPNTFKIKGI